MSKADEKTTDRTTAHRRDFIKLAGATAAGAGATAATGKALARAPDRPTDGDYRETDHVRRYYELAR